MTFIQSKLQSIYTKITTKQVLLFSIIFLLFTSIALPFVASLTTRVIGVAESPDTSFSFNLEQLFELINSYGKDGRRFYILMRWTFDILWPLIYTLFLGSTIAYLARRSNCKFTYKPLYIVLFAVLLDLLENINATILMVLYPIESSIIGYLLFTSSILKWTAIGCSFVILLLLLIRFGYYGSKRNLVK